MLSNSMKSTAVPREEERTSLMTTRLSGPEPAYPGEPWNSDEGRQFAAVFRKVSFSGRVSGVDAGLLNSRELPRPSARPGHAPSSEKVNRKKAELSGAAMSSCSPPFEREPAQLPATRMPA